MLKYLEIGKEKHFSTRPVLRGRTFHTEILSIDAVTKEVIEFYTNLTVLEGNVVTSTVNGVELVFDHIRLGEILKISTKGLVEYVWLNDENCILTSKFSQGRVSTRARKVFKAEMAPFHNLLFKIVHKGILPRGHRRHEACFLDPQLGSYQIAYGNLLSVVFKEFSSSIVECELLDDPDQVSSPSPRAFGPVATLLRDLKAAIDQVVTHQAEIMSLRADLSKSYGEVAKLQEQLVQQQLDNNALMDRVL
ncbi:hypothetical protein R3W88_019199 [Solanum pinnatisectum]|uniref:Uncharacterized protein n=1 Tax=Solanum pinnatisectum TaxID=50273 RepID=A0AAV9KMM1_9SOLN|nr:hypothetical protein R3W88_019199 [Solanum pinnatisectum]